MPVWSDDAKRRFDAKYERGAAEARAERQREEEQWRQWERDGWTRAKQAELEHQQLRLYCQRIWDRHYYDRASYDEIAADLGISTIRVHTIIARIDAGRSTRRNRRTRRWNDLSDTLHWMRHRGGNEAFDEFKADGR